MASPNLNPNPNPNSYLVIKKFNFSLKCYFLVYGKKDRRGGSAIFCKRLESKTVIFRNDQVITWKYFWYFPIFPPPTMHQEKLSPTTIS